jgi:hypothetical protein
MDYYVFLLNKLPEVAFTGSEYTAFLPTDVKVL